MHSFALWFQTMLRWKWVVLAVALMTTCATLLSTEANALPLFARQTGQNCLACHAGGQFPELTPYGRKFKLTGYTLGERAKVPLAVMAVASLAQANNVTNGDLNAPGSPDLRNGRFDFTTASLFCCGKITDNLGLFAQWTYDAFVTPKEGNTWVGQAHVDQVDFRFADRFIDTSRDYIVGLSLNNNPGVADPWNTHNSAFTPVPSYVPASNALFSGVPSDVAAAPLIQGLGQAVAGLNAYGFWNDTLYGEVGLYKTAEGSFSLLNTAPLSQMAFPTRLKDYNPYWRFAYNRDWGPNSAMIGVHGMQASAYSDAQDTSSPLVKFNDYGIDGQYQYILDPHAVTAMFSWTHEKQDFPAEVLTGASPLAANSSNTLDYYRAKGTYVYQAKYGAALAYTSVTGSADTTAYAGSPVGKPDSRLWVPEVFWDPMMYMRVGLQYYLWDQYNGSSDNVTNNTDPAVTNRKASDNNALFLYVWAAY